MEFLSSQAFSKKVERAQTMFRCTFHLRPSHLIVKSEYVPDSSNVIALAIPILAEVRIYAVWNLRNWASAESAVVLEDFISGISDCEDDIVVTVENMKAAAE